jgi:hypothetical protein
MERKADDLDCKKSIVVKSKEVKTGCNLAESSEESYGSLPVMMMIIR